MDPFHIVHDPFRFRPGDPFAPGQSIAPSVWTPADIPVSRRRFSPIVVLFMGRRNAGKTYAMTLMALIQRQRYERHGCPFRIAANYRLDIADYCGQHILDGIILMRPWFRDLYLLLDEIQTALNNRRSMGKLAVNFATMLTMIRKRRVDCTFTTQMPQTIDVQTLYQVDLFVEVETAEQMHEVRLYCHDWWGQYTGMNWRKRWPPRRWEADWVIPISVRDPRQIFRLYDTDEVIASRYLDPDMQEELIEQEYERMQWQAQLPMDDATIERERALRAGRGDPLVDARAEADALAQSALTAIATPSPSDGFEALVQESLRERASCDVAGLLLRARARGLANASTTTDDLVASLQQMGLRVQREGNRWRVYAP
ncbi:MAG: hypothetical protein KatS3mg051_2252 [Anaerolineae bacterium]|nr:MAG: hypothetical protein KatS3mg051_2252 [Anaerolineae bacterium]